MDEYQIEIGEIRRTLSRLKAEKAAENLIEEYEAELRILQSLYRAATEMLQEGERDTRLPEALGLLGFGEWELKNVYAFVYEATMEEDPGGRDLANVITHTDYAGSLRAALEE